MGDPVIKQVADLLSKRLDELGLRKADAIELTEAYDRDLNEVKNFKKFLDERIYELAMSNEWLPESRVKK